jgi:thimet oligopeptidase
MAVINELSAGHGVIWGSHILRRAIAPGVALALIALGSLQGSSAAAADKLGADTGVPWNLTPEQISASCQAALATARTAIQDIDSRAGSIATFEAGLGAIELVNADLAEALIAPAGLVQLAPDKSVRDASQHCADDASAFNVELSADPTVLKIAEGAAALAQSGEQRQLAKMYIEAGRRTGAGLAPASRAKVTRLFEELNKIIVSYNRRMSEDQSQIKVSAEELASLPPALSGSVKSTTEGLSMAVNEGTVGPFLSHEASREARKRYLYAYLRRGGAQNVELLAQAVKLRAQLAGLLGYPNWAAYQLDAKMAKTVKRALALVLEVNRRTLPKARAELAEFTKLKRAAGDSTPMAAWDYAFYEDQFVKARYALDPEAVRAYLPVETVVPAVLGIYQHLLGVRFEQLSPPVTWAPDVSEFAIYDASSGAPLGFFYLDLLPREGKTSHTSSWPMRNGRLLPDGSYRLPIAAMMCNFPRPQAGKPSLLSHNEAIDFFHEFGHVMHGTLSHTRYATLYGMQTRWDFVEAPSQMLENWMWQPQMLKQISSKVGTGEPLPDDMIAKMVAAKHAGDGVSYTHESFYAYYDIEMHTRTGPVDPDALYFSLQARYDVFPPLQGTYPAGALWHEVNGYDAGYYGYLWALVYAQDMFSVFQKEGIDNPAVGLRYRNEILVPGGSEEPDVLLRNFLGREVSLEPFYELIGLSGDEGSATAPSR